MDPSGAQPPLSEEVPEPNLPNPEQLTASQIRAFLAASEEVDIEAATVEELVQILLADSESESSGISGPAADSDRGGENEESESDGHFNLEVSELDMSALYCFADEDPEIWTQQQVRGMLYHLKEHGMASWVNEYILKRNHSIPDLLLAFGIKLSPKLHHLSTTTMSYFLRVAMSRELQLREKLPEYNTVDDAVRLIRDSRRIIILTGVSCGIPDFRSRDGLYASLKERGEYDLDDPQQMFDINYFRENPAVRSYIFGVESQIYPSNFVPSPCHRFIKLVEDKNQNYTQNIDGLHTLAGVTRVLECHGSFNTASCILCHRQVPGSEIEAHIMAQKVPLCTVCNSPSSSPTNKKRKKKSKKKKAKGQWDSEDEDESDGGTYPPGIMKPDITFFGEKLKDHFDHSLAADRSQADLLLVVGTSLKVSPILINKTPVRHINPDIILLGNADDIISHLCSRLGWNLPSPAAHLSAETTQPEDIIRTKKRSVADLHALEPEGPQRVGDSHIWLFEGAEGGEWVNNVEGQLAVPHDTPNEGVVKKPRIE
ncbi:deacetylase sirtuin-type domain-containing protein [Favolaschia claudopus]|uniref:Deacetylase sirtuin-type domain-containing protein n=1 Tax=Favolaschia claudopus TaxID=2862362 RepID=A0AAW0D615_9AGAR